MKMRYKTQPFFFTFSLFIAFGLAFSAKATIYPFHNIYSAQPATSTSAQGTIVGTYNDVSNTVSYTIIFSGLTTNSTSAHFHGPAAPGMTAGIQIGQAGFPVGVRSGTYSNTHVLTDAQETQLLAGLWYTNIHTTLYPGGEIWAQIILGNPATTSPFRNTFSGAQEVPPNSSTATGTIIGSYDHATNTISYSIIFSGLMAPSIAGHFHGPAAPGVATGVQIPYTGFPAGVTSGFYSNIHVLTNTQETQLLAGLWYGNIHTTLYPGGEIRAQILLTDILAPVITNLTASPASLWPPNHKMKTVTISYNSADNFPGVSCRLSVSSSEPVTSKGDNTSPDWVVMNSNSVQLRAERLGSGNGRIYTITVTCTDLQGNSTSRTTTVAVQHDNSQSTQAVTILENNMEGLHFKAYPNPTKNYFNISIQSAGAEKMQLRLFDITGRMLQQKTDLSGNQNLQMGSGLKAGVYFIELQSGSNIKKYQLTKLD
jgi:hypothetical protein